jgi:transcriptional regulator with XRE-family HTH domain
MQPLSRPASHVAPNPPAKESGNPRDDGGESGAVASPERREWMRAFGRQVRRIRDFVGMSQEQVAKAAGVSQGAVSRLESAHGLATPHLVLMSIQQVLARKLAAMDPALLNDELRRAIDVATLLEIPFGMDASVTADAQLEELVRLYRQVPERHREALLAIVRAVADGLKTGT